MRLWFGVLRFYYILGSKCFKFYTGFIRFWEDLWINAYTRLLRFYCTEFYHPYSILILTLSFVICRVTCVFVIYRIYYTYSNLILVSFIICHVPRVSLKSCVWRLSSSVAFLIFNLYLWFKALMNKIYNNIKSKY